MARHAHGAYGAGIVLLALGCVAIPRGRAAVDEVAFEGNETVSEDDLEEHIVTARTPRFLGVARGVVYDYEVYDRFVLQRDLQRIERYYRARGYYRARARAGRVFYLDRKHVRVVIEVEEGPRTYVREVKVEGLAALPEAVRDEARLAVSSHLDVGSPFDEQQFEDAEDALRRVLTDHGYAYAKVGRRAHVDLPRSYAEIAYATKPGPRARFGAVKIVGLGKIPEAPVHRAVNILSGEPYSTEVIEDAEQAVLDLGVFRTVRIEPSLPDPPPADPVVPVTVRVEPSALKGVRLGGGFELDAIRSDVHLIAGWEHRNLFGGLRSFAVEFKPGLVFYPTRLPSFPAPTHYLPEEKLSVHFEQPGFIEARTVGFVRGEYNIFPLLVSPEIDERAPVLGYHEAKGILGVRRRFWRFHGRPSYNLQTATPFAYAGTLDPALQAVVVSFAELYASFDLRDDAVQPHKGVFVGNDFEFAGIGGDARDIKVQPELRGYVPLARRFTLALRASTGFLFAFNYGDTLASNARVGEPPPGVARADWVRDSQLLYFRAFFSGGPNSNRGYPFRGVGPHGVVPFFAPGISPTELALMCDNGDSEFDARCSLPLGGMTLWEASAEARYEISGPFSGATFCDASDVSQDRVDIRLQRPHLSCGVGFRYGTPVGPVRFDVGYRIPGLQVLEDDIPPSEGDPGEIFGIPAAINVGVGEAF